MHHITSLTNPIIKDLRRLHDRKHRRTAGIFLAEGTRIVLEAVHLGWQMKHFIFLHGREDDPKIAPLLAAALKADADIIAVNKTVLSKITRKDNPQTVAATLHDRHHDITDIMAGGGVWVGLDRIRDPGNLGTITRSIDAVGGNGLILIGDCTDPYSVEAVRASMGACFNIAIATTNEGDFLAQLPRWQGRLIGTALDAGRDYRDIGWTPPLIIMMGNEQAGLTPGLTAAAHDLVKIPMLGRSDSLNLAVASGVMLYEYLRRQTD